MKTTNWLCGSLIAILAAGSIGCGQSLRPYSAKGVDTSLTVESEDQTSKAEQAAKDAQLAIDEANALIDSITDKNGNINISLFKKPTADVQTKGLLDPLTEKLRAAFDKVYEKVVLVKSTFAKARQALNDALAKIDQSNPATQAQVALIMAQLAKIDQMEAMFSTQMHALASKLDLATAGLDAIIKGVTTFIPGWGSIIGLALDFLIMGDVKALILELKAKLMAL
jgi:hypothetical protein